MKVIYEPKRRAREYGELACNLFTGCDHGCRYCYCPSLLHKTRAEFRQVELRKDVLTKLEDDAESQGFLQDRRHVFLCFTCDPYPLAENGFCATSEAIKILHRHKVPVRILTKGGMRAARDLHLLGPEDEFGVTLTFSDTELSEYWEPNAAPPRERIQTLAIAKKRGIPTWVSLEPVMDEEETIRMIERSHWFVDRYAVGTLNHFGFLTSDEKAKVPRISLTHFCERVESLLRELGKKYTLKKDLLEWKRI